jgi:hypothetical protein
MKSGFGFVAALTSVVFLLSGCGGVSSSDKRFIAASMPTAFSVFRMYSGNGAAAGRQACLALIRTPFGDAQESVVLERGSGMTFDLSATRDGSDWDVTSDGAAPTADNSAVFRYLLVDCVSALQDKYRAEPGGEAPESRSPLHH